MGIIPPKYHVSFNNTVFYPKKKGFFSLFFKESGLSGSYAPESDRGYSFLW
jgi:hypothetical protein